MFSMEIRELYWINKSLDNPEDLCLHGDVIAVIGDERIEESCTVSAAALYLLKTITENHIINEDNQMLPHCGHFLIPNETNDTVVISGCPYGTDWSVLHNDGKIELTTENGNTVALESRQYESTVRKFADEILSFYQQAAPRKIPGGDAGDFDRKGYIAFWNEWFRRCIFSTDRWFCPAVSRNIDVGLCREYCFVDTAAPLDTANNLKQWIAETQYYEGLEDFHAVCTICSHCQRA